MHGSGVAVIDTLVDAGLCVGPGIGVGRGAISGEPAHPTRRHRNAARPIICRVDSCRFIPCPLMCYWGRMALGQWCVETTSQIHRSRSESCTGCCYILVCFPCRHYNREWSGDQTSLTVSRHRAGFSSSMFMLTSHVRQRRARMPWMPPDLFAGPTA